jgi:hypothetical protein
MGVSRGYIRTKNETTNEFDTFLPITTPDNVVIDGDSGETLETRLEDLNKHADRHVTGPDQIPIAVAGGNRGLLDGNDKANYDDIVSRFSTSSTKDASWDSGVHIIDSDHPSIYSLKNIKGATRINLLGQKGRLNQLSDLGTFTSATAAVDYTNVFDGFPTIQITSTVGAGGQSLVCPVHEVPALTGRNYITIAYVYNISSSKCLIQATGFGLSPETTETNKWVPLIIKTPKSSMTTDKSVKIQLNASWSAVGQKVNISSFRAFEVPDEDLNLSDVDILKKYYYINGITPIRNPYAIRYGENLAPPFYDWFFVTGEFGYVNRNTVKLESKSNDDSAYCEIPAVAGEKYTFSVITTAKIQLIVYDSNKNVIGSTGWVSALSVTYANTPDGTSYIRAYIGNNGMGNTGTYTFENPMLNLGTTAKPFKPREDSMLAFQTELYADPITGNDADEIFERNGVYYKDSKWTNIELDGSLNWERGASLTGFKEVKISNMLSANPGVIYTVKYNGANIPNKISTASDVASFDTSGSFYITISNADSGWGSSYNPSPEDIKAYFNGWRMANITDVTGKTAYDNTGTKGWFQITDTSASVSFVTTIPYISVSKNGYTPYKLIYRLISPIISPIVAEGNISLLEGLNQIKVGEGVVLREHVNPSYDGQYDINNPSSGQNYLDARTKHRIREIIAVYRDGKNDAWSPMNITFPSYNDNNGQMARCRSDYDSNASYSVTYIKDIPTISCTFTGSHTDNEKALIDTIVDKLQDSSKRISVIENKKADKDTPKWIDPTLLNGWIVRDLTLSKPGYFKDSQGFVHIKGVVSAGAMNAAVFILPKGFRPKLTSVYIVGANVDGGTDVLGRVNIDTNGTVLILPVIGTTLTSAGWISLDNIPPFLGER